MRVSSMRDASRFCDVQGSGDVLAEPSTQCGCVTAIHQPRPWAHDSGTTVEHDLLPVALLIFEPHQQLPVILGAPGDCVGTDRTGAEPRGRRRRMRNENTGDGKYQGNRDPSGQPRRNDGSHCQSVSLGWG